MKRFFIFMLDISICLSLCSQPVSLQPGIPHYSHLRGKHLAIVSSGGEITLNSPEYKDVIALKIISQ